MRAAWAGAAAVSLAAVAYADGALFHDEVSSFLFYGIPVALAGWYIGRFAALVFSVLAAATWLWVNPSPEAWERPAIQVWNGLARLGFNLVIALWISGLRSRLDDLVRQARFDTLTGAANARHFYALLEQELERVERSRRPFSLVYLDLDNFKTVNDTLGHPAGDGILVETVKILRANTRSIDRVARLGGDEFALLLPETDVAGAAACMEKVREQFREAMRREGVPVTLSLGIVPCARGKGVDVRDLVRRADELMYRTKRDGKDGLSCEDGLPD